MRPLPIGIGIAGWPTGLQPSKPMPIKLDNEKC